MITIDVNALTSIIGSLGFPIACALGMFYLWDKERKEHKDEITKLTEAMSEQNTKMLEALNNNTVALTRLAERMGGSSTGAHEKT